MRCVHCGKPLGRFRKATGEFCSEEHRDLYRDQIERAALERLLISRKKLTSSQQHASIPTLPAELVKPALIPLNTAGWQHELWPMEAVPAAVFPSSTGPRQGSALSTGPILRLQCPPPLRASHCNGLVETIVFPTVCGKVNLLANGVRLNSAHLGSAFGQLPLPRTLPASCQWSVPLGIDLQAEPCVVRPVLPQGPATGRGQTLRLAAGAFLVTPRRLLLLPSRDISVSVPDRDIQPAPFCAPSIRTSGIMLRGTELECGEQVRMTVAMRSHCIASESVDPIAPACDSPSLCGPQRCVLSAFRLSVAPTVSLSLAAALPAGGTTRSSPELSANVAAMLLLPGRRITNRTEIESGIPDRLDELRPLTMPPPFPPDCTIDQAILTVFRPLASPRLPEAPVETGTAVLPACNRQLGLGQLHPLPLPIALSRENVATFSAHRPAVLPLTPAKPFASLPAAVRLLKLISPPVSPACAAEALKKTSCPTDGFYEAASADQVYPSLGWERQPAWNAVRIRLVRLHAGVAARNSVTGVRGSAEPADASGWQAALKPRAQLVPTVWQLEERESIEAPDVGSENRRLAGIGPVLRWWQSSNRSLKGGVIVFTCMLGFGFYSTITNPQPVSATTESAASAAVTGPLRVLQQSVANRAGVHLSDDFRTGLHAWEGGEEWSDSWSYDEAGFVHPGRLALYTPSLKMSDYRMEFVGQINKKGMGWVVRAADVKNHVAVKLMHVKTGQRPRLAVVRYALVNGKQERHKQVAFPFEARTDTIYHVRMEVSGNRYSLYIQDRMADTWEDDRFTSGGVGFFSANGEDARLRWVRITYQYDWVGRICAALAG